MKFKVCFSAVVLLACVSMSLCVSSEAWPDDIETVPFRRGKIIPGMRLNCGRAKKTGQDFLRDSTNSLCHTLTRTHARR